MRESHCVLSLHIPLLMCIDVVVVIRELGFELIVFLYVVSRFYFLDVLLFNLIQSQSGFPFPHGVVMKALVQPVPGVE